jgi:long-subunit acyl-CoA synthetase (AMP-forming)
MSVNAETPSLAHALHKAFFLSASRPFLGYSNQRSKSTASENQDTIFIWLTYEEVFQKVLTLSNSLRLLSSPKRSVVGICADNSVEWLLTDFSSCLNDYLTVGIHNSWNEETLVYVAQSADINFFFCMPSDVEKFLNLSLSCPSIHTIVVIGDSSDYNGIGSSDAKTDLNVINDKIRILSFSSLLERSRSNGSDSKVGQDKNFSSGCGELTTMTGAGAAISSWFGLHDPVLEGDSDQIFTLMYTSGTTGNPKGVAVTKSRWLVDAKSNTFPGQSDPTVVSYMSLAHGGDRGVCWQACFAGARIGLINTAQHDAMTLLSNIKAVRPTFLLCMSYLWCEYFAHFKRDLERRVLACMLKNKDVTSMMLNEYRNCLCKETDVDVINHADGNTDITDSRLEVCIAAMRQQEDWGNFLDSAASVLGIKDLLLLEWYDHFGGRVFVPVTGGGHTSEEVLQWMVQVFMPPTATLKEQSSRVKNAYGLSEFPGISVNGIVNGLIELELVPVPEHDVYDSASSDRSHVPKVICRRGERFDPSIALSVGDASDTIPTACRRMGEIRVRHIDPSVQIRYWGEDRATAAAVRDGWFYTGAPAYSIRSVGTALTSLLAYHHSV